MTEKRNVDFEIGIIEQLFRQYHKLLKLYALKYINDPAVVEDIVQDVFLELWNRRKEIVYEEAIKSYLFKAVYNRALNHLTSKAYTTQSSLEDNSYSQNLLHKEEDSIESILIVKELQGAIDSYVDSLPPQRKKVFLLSRRYGLKNKEIAEQLGISLKSVEKHITKSLFEIRSYLKKKGLLTIFF